MQEIRFENIRIRNPNFVSVLPNLSLSLSGGVTLLRGWKEGRRRNTVRDRVGSKKRWNYRGTLEVTYEYKSKDSLCFYSSTCLLLRLFGPSVMCEVSTLFSVLDLQDESEAELNSTIHPSIDNNSPSRLQYSTCALGSTPFSFCFLDSCVNRTLGNFSVIRLSFIFSFQLHKKRIGGTTIGLENFLNSSRWWVIHCHAHVPVDNWYKTIQV